MKAKIINRFRAALLLIAALFMSITGYAEKAVDINITKTNESSSIMSSPWVWIVGAAVFVLLLAAILNGGRSKSDD